MDHATPAVNAVAFEKHGAAATWRTCFRNWPAGIPQRGVLVTTFDEEIPFSGFLMTDDLLYLERRTPDTLGARAIILPFENIAALKITDVIDSRELRTMGFKPAFPSKPLKPTQPAASQR